MGAHFAQLLSSPGAPDPQWKVDTHLKLTEMPQGTYPTRTVVDMTWGFDRLGAQTQSLQDAILKETHLDTVLGDVDASPPARQANVPYDDKPSRRPSPMNKTLLAAAAALQESTAQAETQDLKSPALGAFQALFTEYSEKGVGRCIAPDIILHSPFVPTGPRCAYRGPARPQGLGDHPDQSPHPGGW